MKYIFLITAILLICLGAIRAMTLPDRTSAVPVIYWSTDPNPARVEQIRLFHQWLVKNGYITADGQHKVEMRLDTANQGTTKLVVQGVSGVASDVFDMFSGPTVRVYQTIGMLNDVTQEGLKLGFSPQFTYPAIEDAITINGRQYAFPCNVTANLFWVNGESFEKVGMDLPPARWDIPTFERIGREFIQRSNPQGQRQTIFFVPGVDRLVLARSMGVSALNETLTLPQFDDPRYIRTYQLTYQWTYVDHLMPTAAERESFASASGYGGVNSQLFNSGRFALLDSGRYALIQLRQFNQTRRERGQPLLKLSVSELPYDHFPNSVGLTRCAGSYLGSPNKDLAVLFLAYLASEEYNMQIVRDGDALPPNPKYTQIREYTHPPEYPEEWGVHEPFDKAMREIAITTEHGPFIVPATMYRIENYHYQMFMNDRTTAQQAGENAVREVRTEIERMLRESPRLQPLYDEAMATQKKIDDHRAAGKPVPLSWIKNPFHRKYYLDKGWTIKDQ